MELLAFKCALVKRIVLVRPTEVILFRQSLSSKFCATLLLRLFMYALIMFMERSVSPQWHEFHVEFHFIVMRKGLYSLQNRSKYRNGLEITRMPESELPGRKENEGAEAPGASRTARTAAHPDYSRCFSLSPMMTVAPSGALRVECHLLAGARSALITLLYKTC